MKTLATFRLLLMAPAFLLILQASPLAAAPKGLDLTGLPGPLAHQVRAVLSKANTLAKMPPLVLQGPGGGGAPSTALTLPILNASSRPQVSAHGQIGLAWVGGNAAYKAQLLSSAQPVVITSVATTQAVFQSNTIVPGTYTVQITDSGGQTITGTFDVVQSGPVLSPDPIEQYRGKVPPPVFAIAKASLFAKQGRQFYLQAYQLLSPFLDYPDAANLRQALVQGAPVQ